MYGAAVSRIILRLLNGPVFLGGGQGWGGEFNVKNRAHS